MGGRPVELHVSPERFARILRVLMAPASQTPHTFLASPTHATRGTAHPWTRKRNWHWKRPVFEDSWPKTAALVERKQRLAKSAPSPDRKHAKSEAHRSVTKPSSPAPLEGRQISQDFRKLFHAREAAEGCDDLHVEIRPSRSGNPFSMFNNDLFSEDEAGQSDGFAVASSAQALSNQPRPPTSRITNVAFSDSFSEADRDESKRCWGGATVQAPSLARPSDHITSTDSGSDTDTSRGHRERIVAARTAGGKTGGIAFHDSDSDTDCQDRWHPMAALTLPALAPAHALPPHALAVDQDGGQGRPSANATTHVSNSGRQTSSNSGRQTSSERCSHGSVYQLSAWPTRQEASAREEDEFCNGTMAIRAAGKGAEWKEYTGGMPYQHVGVKLYGRAWFQPLAGLMEPGIGHCPR
jgi:hypothetical protein